MAPYKRGDACEVTLVLEDVRLVLRNFSGVEGMYNREGDRNFGIVIPDEDTAGYLEDCGYNVKWFKPTEEGDPPTPWLPVAVSYKVRPPHIVQVTTRGQTTLGEAEVGLLDYVDILKADVVVRPYEWNVQGKTGIKAYVQSLYVTIEEDPLAAKYAPLDEELRRNVETKQKDG